MNRRQIKIVERTVEEFFQRLNEKVLSLSSDEDEETLKVNINIKEPRPLIGKRGEVLSSIQRLLRVILLKKIDERFYLQLDINGYKEKKSQYLKQVAQEVADKVSLNQQKAALLPMSSYERRIIHMELAQRADVETESIGKEPQRKIVVRPA